MTTLGQQGSKVRLAAITLLTNLVEVHTAKEVFELSINGFYHEEFRIREGCCLFVLSVIKECVLIELLSIELGFPGSSRPVHEPSRFKYFEIGKPMVWESQFFL